MANYFNHDPKISTVQAAFNYNSLCTDEGFTNVDGLSLDGVQSFLNDKRSFLRNYSEGGRSAARIIYDASRAHKINPVTILAMIQKEEGLITGRYSTSFNQTRMDWAMGYGYTDSTIYTKYRGFANQVDNGTWQLRRNFDYWAANGSEWNVGKRMVVDGRTIKFANKCTSALYRYTPHLGQNFTYYFDLWGGNGFYDAQYVAQGPRSGPGSLGTKIVPNQKFTIWVNYRNTGNTTWRRTGTNPVHLGTSGPEGRNSDFLGGKSVRGSLVQSRVAPGQIGTFKIRLQAPAKPGVYIERFQPVAEFIKWMGSQTEWVFDVSPSDVISGYKARYISQGPSSGAGSSNYKLQKGQRFTVWVRFKNTGTATWYNSGSNPVRMGTVDSKDRISNFLGYNRFDMVQSRVRPGETALFKVTATAPNQSGTFVEKFQPVSEYITWMGPEMYWTWRVK